MKIRIMHTGSCLAVGGGTEDDFCQCGQHAFIERLRELRLWHWKLGLKHRQLQYDLEAQQGTRKKSSSLKDCIKTYSDAANVHFTAVQTLNEFFPIGDTAERDAENAKQNN